MLLFKVEEHHEAFYIWNYLIKNNLLNRQGNSLFHIDHHSDMDSPVLDVSVNNMLENDLKTISEFTYNQLRISNFIVPAIFLGIFKDFYWMKRTYNKGNIYRKNYIKSHKRAGRIFINKPLELIFKNDIPDDGRVVFNNIKVDKNDEIQVHNKVFLDIDLDFFSSHRARLKKRIIEISKDEYIKIKNDKYHFLNNEFKFDMYEDNNKFFLDFIEGAKEVEKSHLISKEEIQSRIDDFFKYLKNNQIKPSHILLCRSRFSNYTPENQWKFIEKKIIEKFLNLFDLNIISINDTLS
ncbi:MAG: UPF0489 family protein [Candidatus Muiribacteriota bacterium]